jgi:hypothetical protein
VFSIGLILCARVCVHIRAYTDKLHIQHWQPNGWTDRDPNWYKHSLGQLAQVMGVAQAIRAAQLSRASAKQENERDAREYMNGIWRRGEAHIAQGASQTKNCGISDKQFVLACGAHM